MKKYEEPKALSLEQGRLLINNTSLANINDKDLEELLESIRIFCEINYEIYLDFMRQQKIDEIKLDHSTDNVILLNENQDQNITNAA